MAPTGILFQDAQNSDDLADLFGCGICSDLLFKPVTVPCCGSAYCRRCLCSWIKSRVHSVGVPRCPGGCEQVLSFALPAVSKLLVHAIEKMMPEELQRRAEDDREAEEEEEELSIGGDFRAWQEVVAAYDIYFGSRVGVRRGTPGILVGNLPGSSLITVKFEKREDESELCVNIPPGGVMAPLPGKFRLGQRVLAAFDLQCNHADPTISVRLATPGTIVGRLGDDHLAVSFDERLDGGEGPLGVSPQQVCAERKFIGGFQLAQQVQAATDLIVGNRVAVPAGTRGVITGEFSETRLSAAFYTEPEPDTHDTRAMPHFNVLPCELRPWCEPHPDFPVGQEVQARTDIPAMHSVVPAGTRGRVLSGVPEGQVMVKFQIGEEDFLDLCLVVQPTDVETTLVETTSVAAMSDAGAQSNDCDAETS